MSLIRKISLAAGLILLFTCLTSAAEAELSENSVIYIEEEILREALEGYIPLPLRHIYPAWIENIHVTSLSDVMVTVQSYMERKDLTVLSEVLINGERGDVKKFSLPPGEKHTLHLELSEMMAGETEIAIRLEFEKPSDLPSWKDDMVFDGIQRSININFDEMILVSHIGIPMSIDGNLSAWEGRPYLFLGKDEDFGGADPRTVTRTLESAGIYLGWDERHLYLAVSVKDRHHFNTQSEFNIWNGDSIQYAIISQMPEAQAFNLGVALARGRVQSHQFAGPATRLFENSDYTVVRDEENQKTFYEIQMPFENLEMTAKTGTIFRFNLVVFEDSDGSGYDYWLQLTRGIAGGWNPVEFKKFILWK